MQQSTVTNATPTNLPVIQAEVHRTKLQELLREQEGKFVGLDFIKLDGSERKLNGRLGVLKHLAGGEPTIGFASQPYLVMFDVQNKGYRAVNLATVNQVRARNTTWNVIG